MSRRVVVIAGAVVLLTSWIAGADLLIPPTSPEPAPVPEIATPIAGQWVCPVGDDTPATRLAVDVMRPHSTGDEPASAQIVTHTDGDERSVIRVGFDGVGDAWFEPDGVTVVRWEGGPMAVHREWWIEGGDLPAAIVAGGCVHGLSDRWIVPGLTTAGGAEARVRISNPFRGDATVAVSFLTPEGPAEPLALQNLSVGARSTIEVVVNEYLPERDDLSGVVTVAGGRVVTEGLQLVRSAIGGTDGASLLAAAPAPAEQWTVPWVVDGDGRSTWLWIANPGEREAPVELTFHTGAGGTVPDGLTEVIVEPGTMRRVDLRGTLPAGVEVVGVTARADGAPVVVSAATEVAHPDPARSGHVVQLGAPAPDTRWTFAGGATQQRDEELEAPDRDEQLHLINPGSATSTVDVHVVAGTSARQPAPVQSIEVPAGAQVVVDLTPYLADTDGWSVTVIADGPGVVAGRVGGMATGARRLTASLGLPGGAWDPDGPPRPAFFAPGLTSRLGTLFGVREGDVVESQAAEVGLGEPDPDPGEPDPDPDEPASRVPRPDLPIVPGDRPEDEVTEDAEDDAADDGGDADDGGGATG